MFSTLAYTIFAVICLILTLAAVVGLFRFLHKLAKGSQGYDQGKDWYRFAAPTLLAIFLAYWGNDIGMGGLFQWIYFILIAIGLPVACAFFLNREGLEKKNERIAVLVALLFLLNAAWFTFVWTMHYRANHASDGNNNNNKNGNDEGNPHASKLYWFMIPLWVITILVGGASSVMWRKNNQKEQGHDDFLPF